MTLDRKFIKSYVTGVVMQSSSVLRSQMDLFYQLHMMDETTELVKDNSQDKSEMLTE
jgi:hypothetical protein